MLQRCVALKITFIHEDLHVQSVLVSQKDAFQNTVFSRLKCQLKRKN